MKNLMMQAMNSIKAYYGKWGFRIVDLRADHKFEPAQAALAEMEIDLIASIRNKHVPEIEHLNSTMK